MLNDYIETGVKVLKAFLYYIQIYTFHRTILATFHQESERNGGDVTGMKQLSRPELLPGLKTSVVEAGVYGANVVSATIQVQV